MIRSEVVNQQSEIDIETTLFQVFAIDAVSLLAPRKSVTVVFVTDQKITELNGKFRGKNSTTDVLSFPYEPDDFEREENFLGDIIISPVQAQTQANENNLSLELEVKQLILHGILHLLGYDHETDSGEMNTLELKIRDKLKIS